MSEDAIRTIGFSIYEYLGIESMFGHIVYCDPKLKATGTDSLPEAARRQDAPTTMVGRDARYRELANAGVFDSIKQLTVKRPEDL